ncbi:putative allantoinase [Rhypophila decipiens]|uniref:Allantoinase n=1 Tax=Rhypophila decipiens TaxID=261697 RepID=A0AAN6YFH2_9PEZI|nr:putative allantoinase [Rhypophila decipiens]
MTTLKDTPTTLMFHAEMIPPISDSVGDAVQQSLPPLAPRGDLFSYSTFLESRPPAFETYAVEEILSLAELAPNLHLHIVHLSAIECIPLLKKAREAGINITAETCFHYLGLASEDIEDGDTRHKCCPPIRSQTNQDRLWEELTAPDACIKTVVSDHSPCTPELKLLPPHLQTITEDDTSGSGIRHNDSGVDMTLSGVEAVQPFTSGKVQGEGDFFAAWGGISSVGLGLPILHTSAAARRAYGESAPTLLDIVRLCCQATAKQVGLSHRKGGLKVGMDADIAVFDDEEIWTLHAGEMRWKNKCSPWEGHRFKGRIRETWLRGRKVFELGGPNQGFIGGAPVGEAILERRTHTTPGSLHGMSFLFFLSFFFVVFRHHELVLGGQRLNNENS